MSIKQFYTEKIPCINLIFVLLIALNYTSKKTKTNQNESAISLNDENDIYFNIKRGINTKKAIGLKL